MSKIEFTHFSIRDYIGSLQKLSTLKDPQLVVLFKLLSPEHLLKLPFSNDSNSLDKQFYNELLHIIGLSEIKKGSKKLIDRKAPENRSAGSLIEGAINQLDSLDKVSRLQRPFQYGSTIEERQYNVAIELAITWINRILFLKLLEAQLVKYHKGDESYSFLNSDRIHSFTDLNALFFDVLAKRPDERQANVKALFAKIPYLNSSLFEPTDIEQVTIVIGNLNSNDLIQVLPSTILKDAQGRKRSGYLNPLNYLFAFLDSYDFGSESSEDWVDVTKPLISASVLGLIFEKINGYKDGSFFTPSWITMLMCRDSIRQVAIQRFNEIKGWTCKTVDDLYECISDKKEANELINSIRICDPAVGSGHFLVSALNEIIALKSELHILLDRHGRTLRDYSLEVVNDELVIMDDDGRIFEYNPGSRESQRVQEAIFHEKQRIIENCLFGVDINDNSVKICRLRLWIELLKNSYYRTDENNLPSGALETLPNIDINIKTGNSLISRFDIKSDIRNVLKKTKWSISSYRDAVQKYREPESKIEKRQMKDLIDSIKADFRTEISATDPKIRRLRERSGELQKLMNQISIFAESRTDIKRRKQRQSALEAEIYKLTTEVNEIKENKMFENAFEWRFEFPEILSSEGDYIGFDLIIGNPPYGVKEKGKKYLNFVSSSYLPASRVPDSYFLFIVLASYLCRPNGHIAYIVPNTFCDIEQGIDFRRWMVSEVDFYKLFDSGWAFDDAVVETVILFMQNRLRAGEHLEILRNDRLTHLAFDSVLASNGLKINFRTEQSHRELIEKIVSTSKRIRDIATVSAGVKLYEKGKGNPKQTEEIVRSKPFSQFGERPENSRPLIRGGDIDRYSLSNIEEFVKYGRWLAAPRESDLFDGQRIIMRRTDDILRATFISDDSICANSCHIIKPLDGVSVSSLLGLLNSTLYQWVFEQQNPQMVGKAFAEIKVVYVENLPFRSDVHYDSVLGDLVNDLLTVKERGLSELVPDLEARIDKVVYELFNLTEEEIKVVSIK